LLHDNLRVYGEADIASRETQTYIDVAESNCQTETRTVAQDTQTDSKRLTNASTETGEKELYDCTTQTEAKEYFDIQTQTEPQTEGTNNPYYFEN
jgi:hypothetical protein